MELLIIKAGSKYARIKDGEYHFGPMDNASVFPVERVKEVGSHVRELHSQGIPDAAIYKLIILEEKYGHKEQLEK